MTYHQLPLSSNHRGRRSAALDKTRSCSWMFSMLLYRWICWIFVDPCNWLLCQMNISLTHANFYKLMQWDTAFVSRLPVPLWAQPAVHTMGPHSKTVLSTGSCDIFNGQHWSRIVKARLSRLLYQPNKLPVLTFVMLFAHMQSVCAVGLSFEIKLKRYNLNLLCCAVHITHLQLALWLCSGGLLYSSAQLIQSTHAHIYNVLQLTV